jgi:hypothetical protein
MRLNFLPRWRLAIPDIAKPLWLFKVFAEAKCAKQRLLILKEVMSVGNLKRTKTRFGIAI